MSREEEYFKPDAKKVKREGDQDFVIKVSVVIPLNQCLIEIKYWKLSHVVG